MHKILCFMVVVVFIFSLSACGGLHSYRVLRMFDDSTQEKIEIKMKIKNANNTPNMRNFAVSEDIDGLKQLIENNGEDILVEKYQQKYLCLYGEQPFLIEEVEKLEVDAENDHRYFFYAPLATLELIDKSNSSLPVVKKKAQFHLPVHLLKEFERESYYDYIFDIDYSCELVSDFDVVADFYRFYWAFKMYQVEIEDGILSVTNTDTGVTVQIIPGEGNQIWFQIK